MGSILDFIDGLVEVIVFGIQQGAVFALVGLGLALVYKSTRILNFAQGELGTVPALVALLIMVGFDTSETAEIDDSVVLFLVATVVAVLLGAALGVLLNMFVIRRLANVSAVTSLVATVGITLLASSVQIVTLEARARRFPRLIDRQFDLPIFDVPVAWHTILVLAVLGVAAGALAAFFQTPMGIALLATAQEPLAAELQGVPVARMRTLAWATAGALGGLAGILGGGVFELVTPGFMTSQFLVPAFTGVVLGGITSMVGAVVGGLLLGIISQAATKIILVFELSDSVPGPPQVAVLLVLLAVLLIRPRGLLGREA